MRFGNWKIRRGNLNINRYRWLPMVKSLFLFFAIVSVIVYGLTSNSIPVNWAPKDKPVMARPKESLDQINLMRMVIKFFKADDIKFEDIIKSEMPLWNEVNNEKPPETPEKVINRAVYSVTRMDLSKPDTYLMAEIPMMSLVNSIDTLSLKNTPKPPNTQETHKAAPQETPKQPELSSEVQVAIYNTHTSETYQPNDGVTHLKGQRGGVYQVSLELKKVLEEKYGLKTISSDRIHDATNFNFAYSYSLITAQELVQQNKNLKVLIDLHRDGAYNDKNVTTVKINGQDTARIYLILGTDGNLPYPNWQKNKAFAEKLNQKMNTLYPGLSRGVKQDIYRYNQHLNDHAILIEVGGVQNSLEEAKRAIDLFADVLAQVINEKA